MDNDAALFTDLYELTMLQSYFKEGMEDTAVFDLFVRRLPESRNYLLACGLDDVLTYLEGLSFSDGELEYLASLQLFQADFLEYLRDFRFRGDVYAMKEGTPFFPREPVLEVVAPIPQAQLVETYLLNQVTFQSLAASKASRVVKAARGRKVVDFGARRMHGTDAAMKAARAFHIAGVDATSNVLAGKVYGMTVSGTMAHSYIEAQENEMTAFRCFSSLYPETVLLVDTYDTESGTRRVAELARELREKFRVRGIRLDSGDLAELAHACRRILDEAGLEAVEIFASGSLDEYRIAELVEKRAPITGFGVGTRMGVSADAPSLDTAYKLVSYGGRGRMKLSSHKSTLPGLKQVFRRFEAGEARMDLITSHDESSDGTPLLEQVMRRGVRLPSGRASLDDAREHARQQLQALPSRLLELQTADPAYRAEVSEGLREYERQLRKLLLTQIVG